MFDAGTNMVLALCCARVCPSSVRIHTPKRDCENAGSEAIVLNAEAMSRGLFAASWACAGMQSATDRITDNIIGRIRFIFVVFVVILLAKIIKNIKFAGWNKL
jgi:hypothetical protein